MGDFAQEALQRCLDEEAMRLEEDYPMPLPAVYPITFAQAATPTVLRRARPALDSIDLMLGDISRWLAPTLFLQTGKNCKTNSNPLSRKAVLDLPSRVFKTTPNKLRDVGISDEETDSGVVFSILAVLTSGDPVMLRTLSKADLQLLRERIDIKLMQYPD